MEEYKGKHEPHEYDVWRVLGPAGPEEIVHVTGYENAKALTRGCWDSEITRTDTK